jgi:hypothetical protein
MLSVPRCRRVAKKKKITKHVCHAMEAEVQVNPQEMLQHSGEPLLAPTATGTNCRIFGDSPPHFAFGSF